MNGIRENFYSERHEEINRYSHSSLSAAARAVAALFKNQQEANYDTLYAVVRSYITEHAEATLAMDYLVAKGFIWKPWGARYVPGVPSLMDYVSTTNTPSSLSQPTSAAEEPGSASG